MLAALEVGQLRLVVALDPACLVDRNRLPAALGAVLVFQTILYDFELQRTHRTDYPAAVERRCEELRHTLVHKLVDAFGQLLEFHRIGILDISEQLGRERGYASEFQLLALGKRISDLECAGVVQTNYIARKGLVYDRFLLGHERRGRRKLQLLAAAHMQVVPVALEPSGAYLHECYAVAVVGIHVGVYLEDEARHLLLRRIDLARLRGRLARPRGYAYETFEQLPHAEIVDRRAEEYGSHLARQIGLAVECVVNALDQLHVVAQLGCELAADILVEQLRRQVVDLDGRRIGRLPLVAGKQRQVLFVYVVYAAERLAARYRKGQRPHLDLQLALHLVEQIERILARTVELVDKDHYRRAAHAADIHQLARLRLDALGAVDDYYDRVDGRQRAVGILGEVLVAGRVEDVDLHVAVLEAHDRRGHRDASLTLYLHEVRRGALLYLVALHGTRHMYCAAEEQQFLGKGRLTGIGVRYDGEGSASPYLVD